MNTLFRNPRNAQEAAFQARILDRAKSLFDQGGYTLVNMGGGYYDIIKPGCQELYPFGDYGYSVVTVPGKEKCNCPGFEKDGDCKHRIAVVIIEEEEKWEAICGEEDARFADCESEETGCDYPEGPMSATGCAW